MLLKAAFGRAFLCIEAMVRIAGRRGAAVVIGRVAMRRLRGFGLPNLGIRRDRAAGYTAD
jgi:hypothetical protein